MKTDIKHDPESLYAFNLLKKAMFSVETVCRVSQIHTVHNVNRHMRRVVVYSMHEYLSIYSMQYLHLTLTDSMHMLKYLKL